MLRYKDRIFNVGELLQFTIKGVEVEGRLNYDGYRYYVCHDNPYCDGRPCSDKLGYKYSWAFYINGGSLTDSVDINLDIKYKDNFWIDSDLSDMLIGIDADIVSLIKLSNILPEYKGFKLSKQRGFITLINNRDLEVDMKFGRFLKSISLVSNIFKPSESTIEKYHNKFVSFFENRTVSTVILKGDDIKYGYSSKNYAFNVNRLSKSCMNDKLDYLSIYYDNPDRISLVVLKRYDKIVGRALLWLTDCGKYILDRQYISEDWVDSKFRDICKENGYVSINGLDKYTYSVKLENIDLDSPVPYIDSFRYLDYKNNTLYMEYDSGYKVFNETDGTYSS